ncbi:NAD-dependent epimerase/dehydratase [Paramagnetospirillum caucaseum]|uniref:NAD-dependent epimerase/dehydratase n=1 Tax=Paramagnetospirillum caucaseum TaxID=1244869 RepID=M2YC05_9PROT|nr:NAD(P)-dependent oxidoreductase [Paramagnetospirillum caucaseum]EME70536.1 NAD-dependent epimerase/dehydratase [Paramagnetospirillum caucaseum]
MGLNILVTGAGGFVGGGLARTFAAQGHRVTALYRKSRPHWDGAVTVQADLADPDCRLPDRRFDLVIHAAAHTHLEADLSAEAFVASNVRGTLTLARHLSRTGAGMVVHLSTLSVYGAINDPVVDSDTPLRDPGLYGTTKLLAEQVLAEQVAAFPSLSLRLPGVVGPGYYKPWLGRLVNDACAGRPLSIFNPDGLFNNVIDIDGLAEACVAAAARGRSGAGVCAIGAAMPMTIRDLAALVAETAGTVPSIVVGQTAKPSFHISIEPLRALIGFEPKTTADIVRRYVLARASEGKGDRI